MDMKSGDWRPKSISGVLWLRLFDRYSACGGVEQIGSSCRLDLAGETARCSPADLAACKILAGVLGASGLSVPIKTIRSKHLETIRRNVLTVYLLLLKKPTNCSWLCFET